ncbi:MAG TPA: thymidine phosphorylase [Polyangiaceae bacterium]|nr:thymidine phosphorylase [Polyangiaceae bacterium]
MTNPVELILKKRDGGRLSKGELEELVQGYLAGRVAEYQMSAWLMAALLRGLDDGETVALTQAMLKSGRTLALRSVRAPKIDKHSTGGVGDKVSLCLAPLVAACDVAVPMIAGRGLGHTGGTLDKLEAIPGYRVRLDAASFERVLRTAGASIIGQSKDIAPADRRLYALRDVTGTVESVPLIVASILSKKLATGSDGLVLDVKAGRGAFMGTPARARELARALVRTARNAGLETTALVTDMSAPLGRTIGNALETREAIDVLRGEGPSDTRELTLVLGAEMLVLAGRVRSRAAGRALLERALASGAGLERFARMVRGHGGDARVVEKTELLPRARVRVPLPAPRSGILAGIDAWELGWVSVALGAGRMRAEDTVDPGAGIELCHAVGERVTRGEPLAFLCASKRSLVEHELARAAAAFRIGSRATHPRLVLERING